ncbi:uncharacterized protein DNG_05155 [Cephalotrichum gorgonifer]|uniref:Uncharacterized protein n=1 Tax=Cephalotrichum gorgonifer TaxID=2041049 RepID=A0AAE8MXU6_9PEZI|nr:uncharacterized protein DNG_05155 [Cephalotrichum gorgonifer]
MLPPGIVKSILLAASLAGATILGRVSSPGLKGTYDIARMALSPISLDTTFSVPSIIARQPAADKPKGDSCSCIKKCGDKHWYIDPKTCSRCKPCSGSLVADPKSQYKRCTRDRGDDDNDKKRHRDAKERKWPAIKRILNDKFKDREPERKRRQDDRKIKRLSLCVIIAPMCIDWAFRQGVVDEFFDQEYFESGEILQYWSEDLVVEEWELDSWDEEDEENFYSDPGYLEPWERHLNSMRSAYVVSDGTILNGRDRPNAESQPSGMPTPARGYKRFLGGLFNGLISTAGKVGRVTGGSASKAIDKIPPMKFGTRGGSAPRKATNAQQGAKVKEMLDKGPLRWCLDKRSPYNHG